ncbi:hypothetical protein GCM10027592_28640 [Spirosoma flavus]
MTLPDRPRISIALCTYNGSAYLPTQWQSLLDQQLRPDEVIISDDLSTDDTPDLLKKLAAEAPFSVRILNNTNRLGSNKNFERALAACTGDLIFLCDQDDSWLPEKISTMTQYMNQFPEAQVAFCDAWVTDEQLNGRQQRFWEVVRFDKRAQKRAQNGEMMEIILDGNRMMGCATVVRRSFLSTTLPIPADIPGYIYDGWLALVAALSNQLYFIDQPLQLYRTHVQQQVGVREQEAPPVVRLQDRFARRREGKLGPLREKEALFARIDQLLSKRINTETPGMPMLRRRLTHYRMRSHLPENRLKRIAPVFTSIFKGNYHRYADASANWMAPYLAILGDLLE